MEETDLIFLGAQSLLANGSVEMAKGGGIVALVGAEEQKPVLVCCETYKFNDRAAINALDNKNELGCSSDVDSRFVLDFFSRIPAQNNIKSTICKYNLRCDTSIACHCSNHRSRSDTVNICGNDSHRKRYKK